MVQLGASYAHVARILNYTKLTITRWIQHYRVTGRSHNSQQGQPSLHLTLTQQIPRCYVICSDWPWTCHVISHHTVLRQLRPFRGITLMRQLRRLRWARQFQSWKHRNWQRVTFSDESRFQLFRADGRTQIYWCTGERTAPCCVQETVPSGGGSVMVWGGICGQQQTDLIVIDGNLTTPLLAHGGHTRYWNVLCGQYSPLLWVVLYEITHFTPSAVVNSDVIILWLLLSILVFNYCQIIILSKYNICINLCFVSFLILWKNNWYTFFWSSVYTHTHIYIYI